MHKHRSKSDNGPKIHTTRSPSFDLKSFSRKTTTKRSFNSPKSKRKKSNKKLPNMKLKVNRREIECLKDELFESFLKGQKFKKFQYLCWFYLLRDLQRANAEEESVERVYERYLMRKRKGVFYVAWEGEKGVSAEDVFASRGFERFKGEMVRLLERAYRVYGMGNQCFGEGKVRCFEDVKIKEGFRRFVKMEEMDNDLVFLERVEESEDVESVYEEYCDYKNPKVLMPKNIRSVLRQDKKQNTGEGHKIILEFVECSMVRQYELYQRKMKLIKRVPLLQITLQFLLDNPKLKSDFLEFLWDLDLSSLLLFYLDYEQFKREDDMFLFFKMKHYFFYSYMEHDSFFLSECVENDINEDTIRDLCLGLLDEVSTSLQEYVFRYFDSLFNLGAKKISLCHQFEDVLLHPPLYLCYFNYLKPVKQESHLSLYRKIHEYKTVQNPKLVTEIYQEFFETKKIELDRNKIFNVKENLDSPSADIYDDILASIRKGLERNFSRFLNSEEPKQKKYSVIKQVSDIPIESHINKSSNKKIESRFLSKDYILSSYSNVQDLYLTDINDGSTSNLNLADMILSLEIPSAIPLLSYANNDKFIFILIGPPYYLTVYDIDSKQFISQKTITMTDEDKNQFIIPSNSSAMIISSEKRLTNFTLIIYNDKIISTETHFSIKRKSGQALKQNFTRFLNPDLILLGSHSSLEVLRLDTLEVFSLELNIPSSDGIMKITTHDAIIIVQTTYSIFTYNIHQYSVTADLTMTFEFPIGSCLYHESGMIYIGSFSGYLYTTVNGEIIHTLSAKPILEDTSENYRDLTSDFKEKIVRIESDKSNKIIAYHKNEYISIWKHANNLAPSLLTTCDIPAIETQTIINNTLYTLGSSKLTKIEF